MMFIFLRLSFGREPELPPPPPAKSTRIGIELEPSGVSGRPLTGSLGQPVAGDHLPALIGPPSCYLEAPFILRARPLARPAEQLPLQLQLQLQLPLPLTQSIQHQSGRARASQGDTGPPATLGRGGANAAYTRTQQPRRWRGLCKGECKFATALATQTPLASSDNNTAVVATAAARARAPAARDTGASPGQLGAGRARAWDWSAKQSASNGANAREQAGSRSQESGAEGNAMMDLSHTRALRLAESSF